MLTLQVTNQEDLIQYLKKELDSFSTTQFDIGYNIDQELRLGDDSFHLHINDMGEATIKITSLKKNFRVEAIGNHKVEKRLFSSRFCEVNFKNFNTDFEIRIVNLFLSKFHENCGISRIAEVPDWITVHKGYTEVDSPITEMSFSILQTGDVYITHLRHTTKN